MNSYGNLKFNAFNSFITTNHSSVPESDCLIVFEIYGKIVVQRGWGCFGATYGAC